MINLSCCAKYSQSIIDYCTYGMFLLKVSVGASFKTLNISHQSAKHILNKPINSDLTVPHLDLSQTDVRYVEIFPKFYHVSFYTTVHGSPLCLHTSD